VATEVYDPVTNGWSATRRLSGDQARLQPGFATRLRNGHVLIASATYDPSRNRWAATRGRVPLGGDATLLMDGRVLAVSTTGRDLPARVDLYDPRSNRWWAAGRPPARSTLPFAGQSAFSGDRTALQALADGRVLAVGGLYCVPDPSLPPEDRCSLDSSSESRAFVYNPPPPAPVLTQFQLRLAARNRPQVSFLLNENAQMTFTFDRRAGARWTRQTTVRRNGFFGRNQRRFVLREPTVGQYRVTVVAHDPFGRTSVRHRGFLRIPS
jgi:hypothetical protein